MGRVAISFCSHFSPFGSRFDNAKSVVLHVLHQLNAHRFDFGGKGVGGDILARASRGLRVVGGVIGFALHLKGTIGVTGASKIASG